MAFKQVSALALLLLTQVGRADSAPRLRSQLERRYAVMAAAIESKDEARFRSVLDDRFIDVDVDGNTQSAAQMLKGLPAIPNDLKAELQIKILSVRGNQRAAVVKQRAVTTAKVKDTDGSEKSAVASAISTDNWLNENGYWRLVRSVMVALDGTVDGKAVFHKRNPTAQ